MWMQNFPTLKKIIIINYLLNFNFTFSFLLFEIQKGHMAQCSLFWPLKFPTMQIWFS